MTTTPKHTPTPWTISPAESLIWGPNSQAACWLGPELDGSISQRARANGALIILAVNNHAALLKVAKAIESAMSLADFPSSESVAAMNAIEQLRPQLKAAIAAAEGQTIPPKEKNT